MKVEVLSKKVICSNENSIHNYFGWPTVARLQDGRLAMVASGFRLTHRCPFGKVVICYSSDEGRTWTKPAVVIDTPLDDRDGGIAVYGEKNVLITSFNNSLTTQRSWVPDDKEHPHYRTAYLDIVERNGGWEKYLGSTFCISHDGGNTFGPVQKIPVSCPHGPAVLQDGTLLYVGTRFDDPEVPPVSGNSVVCYRMQPDGSYEYLSDIEDVGGNLNSYEPHAIQLKSGKIIVHIRVQDEKRKTTFTIYQCESDDGGKTFTKPHQILGPKGGSPAHLLEHEGVLISVVGYRAVPYGIRVAFSKDEGLTWDDDHILVDDSANWDVGYPSTVALKDGTMLTTFYGRLKEDGPAVIQQVIWKYTEE